MTRSRSLTAEQRVAAGVALVTLVLFALVFPATTALDRRTDRARPLYDDVLAVARYEWEQIDKGGRPVPLTLEGDGAEASALDLALDRHTERVSVTAPSTGTGYCIEARNSFGDETGTLCFEGRRRPDSVLDDRS